MSEADSIIRNAQIIRNRLIRPPNAVKDDGIDLRRGRLAPTKGKVIEHLLPPKDSDLPNKAQLVEFGREPPPPKKVMLATILKAVGAYYGVSEVDLLGPKRNAFIVLPRHVAMYLATQHTDMSYAAIGRRMKKDHTVVIKAEYRISEMMLVDDKLAELVKMLELRLFAGYYDP